MATIDPSTPGASLLDVAESQLARWKVLVDEHEIFRSALKEHYREIQGIGPLISQLHTETTLSQEYLTRAHQLQEQPDHEEEGKLRQKLNSSNLSSCESQWDLLKKLRGVKAINPYFSKTSRYGSRYRAPRGMRDMENVLVNAVVSNGSEWVRIFTTTERRALLDMASNGWEFGLESDDEGSVRDDEANPGPDTISDDDFWILQVAKDLVKASQIHRLEHNYACPSIRIVFTRLHEGKTPDIDTLIRRIRRLGNSRVSLTVECADSPFVTAPPPPYETALPGMLPNELRDLTPTVNIDTSILVALASDISHSVVKIEPHHSKQHVREVLKENENPGKVLALTWAALRGRKLVTTKEAAASLGKLVGIIGTDTERERARFLIPGGRSDDVTSDKAEDAAAENQRLLSELRKMSSYPVPDDIQLPIQVVDEAWDLERIKAAVAEGSLPTAACRVAPEMSTPTFSVFCYGWASRHMTITANASAPRQIARLVDKYRNRDTDDMDNLGPNVWVVGTARSLNGNKKDKSSA